MFRAPTEKHSQIIATFGDTIPKTSETVVLVGKSPKQKLKNQELQKRNYSSSIWMCMNKVRYATSYQIHSTLLLNPSYTSYTSPLKKGIKSIAPFSFFVPTKKKRPKTPPKSARMLVAISPTIPCQPREALEEDGPLEVQAHQGTGPGETVPPSTGGFKFEPEFLRERFVKFLDM